MTNAVRTGAEGDVIPGRCFGYTRLPVESEFVASRGEGSRLWSTDGRMYVDYVLGSGPLVVGHCHERVVAAVSEQLRLGTHFYVLNERAVELASKIVADIPSVDAVKFCADGSGATFFAIRLARAFTGRSTVLRFEGGYHGYHDYALPGFGETPGRYGRVGTRFEGVPKEAARTVVVAPFNDIEVTRELASGVAGDLAAIVVEPIQRTIMPDRRFLVGLRRLCDSTGALLIFDEVVTGFRVVGKSAQALFDVRADLTALGKAIGGGLPLAAVGGPRNILELTIPERQSGRQRVFMSGTLNGNPLSAAAGLATLTVMDETAGIETMNRFGAALKRGIIAAAERYDQAVQVIGPDSFFEVVFGDRRISSYKEYLATDRRKAMAFGEALLRRGIYVVPGAKWYVSVAHGDEDLEVTLKAVDASLADVVRRETQSGD